MDYNVALTANASKVVKTGYTIKTGDKGQRLIISVTGIDMEGTTAKIVFLRANNTAVESGDIIQREGHFEYVFKGNELIVAGRVIVDVKFYETNRRESTASFIFEAISDTLDSLASDAAPYSDTLERLSGEMQNAIDNYKGGVDAIEQRIAESAEAVTKLEEDIANALDTAEQNFDRITTEKTEIISTYVDNAEAAANAANDSAVEANGSAERAEAAAESIRASKEQIDSNTADIAQLKENDSQLSELITEISDTVYGELINVRDGILESTKSTYLYISAKAGDTIHVTSIGAGFELYLHKSKDDKSGTDIGYVNANKEKTFTLDYDIYSIRAYATGNGTISAEVVNRKIPKIEKESSIAFSLSTEMEASLFANDETFDTSDWGVGYYYYYTKGTGLVINESATTYKHSPIIPVQGGCTILLRGFAKANSRVAYIGYEDGSMTEVIDSTANESNPYEIILPYNANKIAFSARATTSTVTVSYFEKYKYDKRENDEVNAWVNLGIRPSTFHASAKPIFTITDDDTSDINAVRAWHDVLTDEGITGTYAVVTKMLENNATLKNLLLSYEDEGYHMALHCYEQVEAFKNTSARDISVVKSNFLKGLRQMREFGFSDPNHWITPYGSADKDLQDIAVKWGMNDLVSIGQNTFNGLAKTDDRFMIKRIGLNPRDSDGSVSLANLKTAMMNASTQNGWIVVCTHFNGASGDWSAYDPTYSRVHEVIQYAKELGFEIMSLNEAYRKREATYRFWEAFK